MIRYTPHSGIDKNKWDELVSRHSDLLYPRSWWLDIVNPGWDALVEDDYVAVMPLTHRTKFGFSYLFQPSFTQQLGVFGRSDAEAFLSAIPKKFRLVEINLHEKNTGPGAFRKNHLLNLSADHDTLFRNYSENHRRNIKKAREEKFLFDTKVSADELIKFYNANQGKKYGLLPSPDEQILRALIRETVQRQCGMMVGIRDQRSEIKGAAFFVWSDKRVVLIFSASDLESKTRWMALLLDLCIAHDAGKDRILDLEGGNEPDLARFYSGFGAKEVVYLHVKKNELPFWIRWLK